MIGYGNLSSEEIYDGIEILAKHLDRNLSNSI